MFETVADPPVREDGLCVVCTKPREPNRSRRYGRAEAETDPFCSTQCCREWYGVPIDVTRKNAATATA